VGQKNNLGIVKDRKSSPLQKLLCVVARQQPRCVFWSRQLFDDYSCKTYSTPPRSSKIKENKSGRKTYGRKRARSAHGTRVGGGKASFGGEQELIFLDKTAAIAVHHFISSNWRLALKL
jgi:hypothetical protein